jgi:hypothetical protein
MQLGGMGKQYISSCSAVAVAAAEGGGFLVSSSSSYSSSWADLAGSTSRAAVQQQ